MKASFQGTPFRRLLAYGRPHRRVIRKASLFSVLNKIFDLAPPALIGAAVDIVIERENSLIAKFGYSDGWTQLLILTFLTLVIWGLESLFEYKQSVAWRNLAQTVQHEMRLDLYGHVQEMELAFFEDRSTGGLMSVMNDDGEVAQRRPREGEGGSERDQTSENSLVISISSENPEESVISL